MDDPWRQLDWVEQTQLLLDSYRHWLGRDLSPRDGSPELQAKRLYESTRVVVSHGIQADPILNYGNRAALELWEMDAAAFCQTPSRLTAEPIHRDERAELLARTSRDGFVDDYQGIRISSTGRRFLIHRATVWNLVRDGEYRGQAATFTDWSPITPDSP